MKNLVMKTYVKAMMAVEESKKAIKEVLSEKSGEGHVETSIKVLIGCVVGALILAAIYSMFKDTLIPKLQQKIIDMFNYKG